MTRHDKLIATAIGLVAMLFLALWLLGSGRLADFGLNGFTETLGIAFTVLLIDHLLGRREAARTLPQRLAAFEDVRLVVQRRITFWFQAYMLAVPDPLPTSVRELLSPRSIARIGSLLDMDSYANVTPRRNWWPPITLALVFVAAFLSNMFIFLDKVLETSEKAEIEIQRLARRELGLIRAFLQLWVVLWQHDRGFLLRAGVAFLIIASGSMALLLSGAVAAVQLLRVSGAA